MNVDFYACADTEKRPISMSTLDFRTGGENCTPNRLMISLCNKCQVINFNVFKVNVVTKFILYEITITIYISHTIKKPMYTK
jgi:hypothetical protein